MTKRPTQTSLPPNQAPHLTVCPLADPCTIVARLPRAARNWAPFVKPTESNYMAKFTTLDRTEGHDYGNVYFRQPCGDAQRLVIGVSRTNVKMLDALSKQFSTPNYFILYVLLISHAGYKPGRYSSPRITKHEDLQMFIWTFQEFFEGDGRHHIWIGSPDGCDLLVYDQHDVIFAYGNLDAFELVLKDHGFAESEFWFPVPHSHSFDPANAATEDDLMGYFEWTYSELEEQDEWD